MKVIDLPVAIFGHGKLAIKVLEYLLVKNVPIRLVNDSAGSSGELTRTAKNLAIATTSLHPRKETASLQTLLRNSELLGGLLISVNYRYVIDQSIIENFLWPINVHGSLLPKYRGRTPHVWAIINGEEMSGITVHVMDAGVDTGPIIHQRKVEIRSDVTGWELLNQLSTLYPRVVYRALQELSEGRSPREQSSTGGSYFGKRSPEMGLIDFRLPFHHLKNFVRAQAPPYPGAYTYLSSGKRIIVVCVELVTDWEYMAKFSKYCPVLINNQVLVKTDYGVVRCITDNGSDKVSKRE